LRFASQLQERVGGLNGMSTCALSFTHGGT
jgi:hypothetical protein